MPDHWQRIEQAFKAHGVDPAAYLQPGASDDALAHIEEITGQCLPEEMKEFYRVHDGQKTAVFGILFGIELLSARGIMENWQNWKDLENDGLNEELADSMTSKPDGFIRKLYVNPRWLPFTHDQSGNHIGIDFDPDVRGRVGQVIAFGRDDDQKKLVNSSFAEFLDTVVHQLETIPWSLDASGWHIEDDKYGDIHYHDWDYPRQQDAPGA
jgi:cell wall assembly regulator SMI1